MALALLTEFGSLGAIFKASSNRVSRIAGPDAAKFVGHLGSAFRLSCRSEAYRTSLTADAVALRKYLHAALAHDPVERLLGLFLDARGGLIDDTILASGQIDAVSFPVRNILVRALELNAKIVIVAHNHPSGDTSPSRADIESTKRLVDALRHVDIRVRDHLIVGRSGITSLREQGLL